MLTRALQKGAANSWRMSSAKYGGRTWPLVVLIASNLAATTLFGGSLAILLVTATETLYALLNPDRFSWFSAEASSALIGYAAIAFFGSMFPILLSIGINRRYRLRCKNCGR